MHPTRLQPVEAFEAEGVYDYEMNRRTEEARRLEVLTAYVSGEIPRGTAMEMLGLDWYGDMLVLANQHSIARPTASHEQMAAMEDGAALLTPEHFGVLRSRHSGI